MNTNILKKDAALFAKYTWVDINAPIRSSKLSEENYRPMVHGIGVKSILNWNFLSNFSKLYLKKGCLC